MPLCINATISIIKKIQYDFPKMGGGVKGRLELYEYSSVLVGLLVPKRGVLIRHHHN